METVSITVLLCLYKRRSRRHKCSSGRSISEAAPCYGNLCVYEPSALRKKPTYFRKKPSDLRKKPSDLRCSCAANSFQKNVPNFSVNFYQPAVHFTRGRLVLRLLCGFHVYIYIYMCVRTCHVRNNYVTYIVAMQPYFSRLGQILDGCFV